MGQGWGGGGRSGGGGAAEGDIVDGSQDARIDGMNQSELEHYTKWGTKVTIQNVSRGSSDTYNKYQLSEMAKASADMTKLMPGMPQVSVSTAVYNKLGSAQRESLGISITGTGLIVIDASRYKREGQKYSRAGWSVDESLRGTLTHEVGHKVMDDYRSGAAKAYITKNRDLYLKESGYARSEQRKGKAGISELQAEAFSRAFRKGKKDDLDKGLRSILKSSFAPKAKPGR